MSLSKLNNFQKNVTIEKLAKCSTKLPNTIFVFLHYLAKSIKYIKSLRRTDNFRCATSCRQSRICALPHRVQRSRGNEVTWPGRKSFLRLSVAGDQSGDPPRRQRRQQMDRRPTACAVMCDADVVTPAWRKSISVDRQRSDKVRTCLPVARQSSLITCQAHSSACRPLNVHGGPVKVRPPLSSHCDVGLQ